MIPQINIPVPAVPGVGAWVNIAGTSSLLTVLNCFATNDDNVILEQSFDAGVSNGGSIPGAAFNQTGPATLLVEAEGNAIRARRLSGGGGAYNLHAASQAGAGVGALQTINVPANPGSGGNPSAGIDISGQPLNLNLSFGQGATSNDSVLVQHSMDGNNWAPLTVVQGLNVTAVTSGANQMRTNRQLAGNAGVLQIQGVPVK